MKQVLLSFALVVLFSCRDISEEKRTYYYKFVLNDSIVAFQQRDYVINRDLIEERISTFKVYGDTIEKYTVLYKNAADGLDISIRGHPYPYLRVISDAPCVKFPDPRQYYVENCYLSTSIYKGNKNSIKYRYSAEIIDGISMIVFVDEDYALIDQFYNYGTVDSLLRIDSAPIFKVKR